MNTTQQLLSDTGHHMARVHTTEAGQTVVDLYSVTGSFSAWVRRVPATPENAEQVALDAFADEARLAEVRRELEVQRAVVDAADLEPDERFSIRHRITVLEAAEASLSA